MRPKPSEETDPQGDLYRSELKQIISLEHPLSRLADEVSWARFDEAFDKSYCENNGRPAKSTRLLVSLHYLKYTYNLSDEATVEGWLENPYWQYLSGMKYFSHKLPLEPSSMTRWRKRVGEAGAEELLKETLEAGLRMKAVKTTELKRVNVDTTVQEKDIRYPTDARLYQRAREHLVKAAEERGLNLRQSYKRVGKQLLHQQSRYAHARQMNRARRCTSRLRTLLGRVIRDIERKASPGDEALEQELGIARRLYEQKRGDTNKVYSVHETHVACIAKGKAHKRYEFGVKVSVAATSKGGWCVGACAFSGNPYDGHTLFSAIEQIERLLGKSPQSIFVDRGYQGHNYTGHSEVHVDRLRRGKTPRRLWKWMKRRAAVEPTISHLKHTHRMNRNRLKGLEGDRVNVLLSAAAMNFSKLLHHAAVLLRLFLAWLSDKLRITPADTALGNLELVLISS